MADAATFDGARRYVDPVTFRDRMKDVLGRAFGSAKHIAQAARRSPRAAENQLAGLNNMRAHTLVNLMRESEEVLREVLTMAGRTDLVLDDAEQKRRFGRAARIIAGEDDA